MFTIVQWLYIFQVLITIILLLSEKISRTMVVLASSGVSIFILRFLENIDPGIIYEEFINWHTITLIIGMTILVENLKENKYFDYWSIKVVIWSKLDPLRLFVFLGLFTLFLSAFLDNVSAIILLASLSIVLAERLEIDPIPIILYQAFITGIGGLLTPVGSVPTIIINGEAKIPFFEFMINMAIITFVAFVITTIYFYYRFQNRIEVQISPEIKDSLLQIEPNTLVKNKTVIIKGNLLLITLFSLFIASEYIDLGVDYIALGIGVISMFTFNVDSRDIWHQVNWDMLFFFIGLFVIIGGLEHSGALEGVEDIFFTLVVEQPSLAILFLLIIGGIAAAFLDAIPVALILASMFSGIQTEMMLTGSSLSTTFWYAAVFATNIGGGLAPIGSVTILMALEALHEKDIKISFKYYIILIAPLFLVLSLIGWVYFLII